MPQKSIITPILGNEYYHIFNRGNNGCRLFFNETNYALFLKLYREFVAPYCETLSYCLIANHFHLLVKTNASVFIPQPEVNSESYSSPDSSPDLSLASSLASSPASSSASTPIPSSPVAHIPVTYTSVSSTSGVNTPVSYTRMTSTSVVPTSTPSIPGASTPASPTSIASIPGAPNSTASIPGSPTSTASLPEASIPVAPMSIGTLSIGPTPGAYAPENFKSGNTSLGTSRPVISTPDTCIQESSASIVSLQGHSETEPSLRKARNDNMLVDPYWFEEPTGLNEKPLLATVYEGYQPVDKTTPTNGFYITNKEAVGRFISEQFRRMFLQYALIIKKQEDIKGSLFVKPFRRLMIEQQNYLEQVIFYIHTNPAKHEVQRDYKSYRYSSYRHILSSKSTFLARNHVLDIFGGVKGFDEYHDWRWEEREAILAASKSNEELQE